MKNQHFDAVLIEIAKITDGSLRENSLLRIQLSSAEERGYSFDIAQSNEQTAQYHKTQHEIFETPSHVVPIFISATLVILVVPIC